MENRKTANPLRINIASVTVEWTDPIKGVQSRTYPNHLRAKALYLRLHREGKNPRLIRVIATRGY